MRFEWDEKKRLANLDKHGLDFIDVVDVFEAPHVEVCSSYTGEEKRFLAIGMFDGRFVTAVYTHRGENIRIISFRRARHEERRKHQELHSGRA